MRILIALDLNDDDLTEAYEGQPISWRDMRASLDARLEEAGYFGSINHPVRGTVLGLADVSASLEHFLSATQVGLEGILDDEDWGADKHISEEAWKAAHQLLQGVLS
jgi:hypothetical protein